MDDDEEETENDGVVKILAGVGFAAALLVLAFQLLTAKVWISGDPDNNPQNGDWSQLIQ